MRKLVIALSLAVLAAAPAHAWWNKDWTQHTQLKLDTGASGVPTKEAVANLVVPVRLHSGNFDFLNAKEDGSDLRFMAGDDKTPLAYEIERFDATNELALVWVTVPSLLPGTDKNAIHVYAGNPKAASEASAKVFGAPYIAAIHFGDKEGAAADSSTARKASAASAIEANGLLAGSAKLAGESLTWPAADTAKLAAGAPATVSFWIKPDAAAKGPLLRFGALQIGLDGGALTAQVGTVKLGGGEVKPAQWTHVALTLASGKATLYANGAQVAQADATAPELAGEIVVGGKLAGAAAGDAGYTGLFDELEVASVARSADWLHLATAAQGPDGKLITATKGAEGGAEEGGHPNYIGVLVGNLTTDAWIVIIILGIMFVIACWVMVTKSVFVARADKDNGRFLQRFRGASLDLMHLERGAAHPNSSIFRLYQAGVRELKKRDIGLDEQVQTKPLSGASLDAVKASIDADLVRESHRLNSQMVLLTIAISGGPFLGLLGTVVGVMITFAAIAAAGDVNVNAIAPGIAAALLATVAGLGVAIPALFGYNYLASRIKNISADMQIFVDEFVTRVAETYGAR
ncbi:DUF2341 domain-containing protein [soil metagenome]